MSKKFKFELNSAGVRALLQGPQIQTVLTKYASNIRARAGDGYEQDIHVGKNRANAMVWAESFKAKGDNKKNNTLLKAVR